QEQLRPFIEAEIQEGLRWGREQEAGEKEGGTGLRRSLGLLSRLRLSRPHPRRCAARRSIPLSDLLATRHPSRTRASAPDTRHVLCFEEIQWLDLQARRTSS